MPRDPEDDTQPWLSRLTTLRCPTHGQPPTVIWSSDDGDTVQVTFDACCEEFKRAVLHLSSADCACEDEA